MRQCDTIINGGLLVTQNDQREILENHAIAIKDRIIQAIAPVEQMAATWQAEKVLDLPEALIMPGLINAHTHAAMTFLRGLADDLPLLEWLHKHIFPVEAKLTREISKLGSLLGYAEMLASGTTACIDMYIFEDAVFEAARTAGLRCMGGEAIFAFPSAACESWRDALDSTRALAEQYKGDSRIKVAVNPHSVYTTNAEILGACRKLAVEMDMPLHIHLAESASETDNCLQMHQCRPVEWCDRNGLFDCHVIAAHVVDVTRAERDCLAKNHVTGAHNPSSNMKLASGVAPLTELLRAGVNMALGTDGPASNNTLNMFVEMGRAGLLHKSHSGDPAAMPAGKVLDMATRAGAKAFGDKNLGSLEVGKAADCIALDLRRPNMRPMHNAVSQIVYAASGHECVMTMVEGEVLYENGSFSRFDYADLLAEAETLKQFVKKHM